MTSAPFIVGSRRRWWLLAFLATLWLLPVTLIALVAFAPAKEFPNGRPMAVAAAIALTCLMWFMTRRMWRDLIEDRRIVVDPRARELISPQGRWPFSAVAAVAIVRFDTEGHGRGPNAVIQIRLRDGIVLEAGDRWTTSTVDAFAQRLAHLFGTPIERQILDGMDVMPR